MVVFLKTSEEAVCDPVTNCKYTWTDSLPNVTAFNVSFDETSYTWELKAVGTGFTGDTSTVELYIANRKQTTKSVSTTEAIFTIVNVTSSSLNSNKLYFPEGIPENHNLVASTFNITPRYVSVSPNSGSIGGSKLTATVPGVTQSSTVDILGSSGSSICANASVTSYGVITCKTITGELTS